ncbi:MAG: glycosyltransferase, partial [Proteobacteria bacterium]|nr:glycosyltransferase [Pseudomonadota bacterium]
LGLGEEPLVLVTAGGGADGSRMMTSYLEGLLGRPGRGFKTLLVTGPEMSPQQGAMVAELAARAGGVIVKEFCDDMMSHMNAADLVVSMGGYNTVCELLTLKKKTIIVPRVAPVQEQWIRAERMQARGLLRAIHPDELTPNGLLDAVVEELSRDDVENLPLQQFEMDGLPRISAAVFTLLDQVRVASKVARPASRKQIAGPARGFTAARSLLAGAMQRAFGSAVGA